MNRFLLTVLILGLIVAGTVYGALPQTVNPSSPADTDPVSQGAARIREGRTYLIDILGVPNNVAVSGAALNIATDGTTNGGAGFGDTTTMVKFNGLVRYAAGLASRFSPDPAGDDYVLVSQSTTSATFRAMPDCQDSSGNHLNYTAAGNTFSCGTTAGVNAATQADQETGTSTTTAVTPGRQQYHPSATKAWARWNGTGTPSLTASYNMASITDNGVGDFTLTFTVNFSGATQYGCVGMTEDAAMIGSTASTPAANTIRVNTETIDGTRTRVDVARNYIVCFGDQ